MKRGRLYLLSFLILCGWQYTNGQTSVQVEIYPNKTVTLSYEKFDINAFRVKVARSGSLDYAYTEPDGTQKRVTCQRRGEPIQIYETPPLPAVYRIFSEYYPNGNLKSKGLYLPNQFVIGKWLECDQRGNCSVDNKDAGRGTFDYNGVLKILEDKGYINTSTGDGNWTFVVWYNENARQWGIKLQKDAKYKLLEIDANSGEIRNESEYEVTPGNIAIQGEYIAPE